MLLACNYHAYIFSLDPVSMKAEKDHEGFQLLHTMVDLQLCQHTGCDSTPLLQTANALLMGDT